MKPFSMLKHSMLMLAVVLAIYCANVYAEESWVVTDIRLEGLVRVPAAEVFATLTSVAVGQRGVTQKDISQGLHAVFATGNFDDVTVYRDSDELVFVMQERPSIDSITIDGNRMIQTEQLLMGLNNAQLREGAIFKRSTLENIRVELQEQYVSNGRYDADITVESKTLSNNRVELIITVDEGSTAKVKHINIVGNERFSTQTLLGEFTLKPTNWLSWIKGNDKYAKERLRGDFGRLESFYKDQGYLKFAINSSQVSLSPKQDAVYLSMSIFEGDVYHVSSLDLSGELILDESFLKELFVINVGDVYSQRKITATEELIAKVLGSNGYVYANVRHYLDVDEDNKTVDITFFVDPGQLMYVNRIEFKGNQVTQDEVLRREFRQMEAAPVSGPKLEQSKVRLQRLGHFKSVDYELVPVPDSDDRVDVITTVEEQNSGSIGASIGYSEGVGAVFSADLTQNNFFGTGNRINLGFSKDRYRTQYNIRHTDPYHTIDGVTRTIGVFYRETDFEEINVAAYSTDSYGLELNYTYPINESMRIGFGLEYNNLKVVTGLQAPQEVQASPRLFGDSTTFITRNQASIFTPDIAGDVIEDLTTLADSAFDASEPGFLDRYGDQYDMYLFNISWSQSALNRGLFPTQGYSQRIGLEVAVPETEVEYYKVDYRGQWFASVADEMAFRFHGRLGFGDGYGDLEQLPFFRNYFAGGFGSVRGFENSSLGPKASPALLYLQDFPRDGSGDATGDSAAYIYDPLSEKLVSAQVSSDEDPFGGNILFQAGVEYIFPLWFIKERDSLRTVLFVDSGNVFDTDCRDTQLDCSNIDAGELRYSAGFGLTWVTLVGPLSFSVSRVFNENSRDEVKFFQFSIGSGF